MTSTLRAGPLELRFDAGDLRYLKFGQHEVIRRIYAGVRDRNWGRKPIRVSENRRHFVGAKGQPFFCHADTGWHLFEKLSREEVEPYLENAAATASIPCRCRCSRRLAKTRRTRSAQRRCSAGTTSRRQTKTSSSMSITSASPWSRYGENTPSSRKSSASRRKPRRGAHRDPE